MSSILEITSGLKLGKELAERPEDRRFQRTASFDREGREACEGHGKGGRLVLGDNLDYMKQLLAEGYAGKIRTVYIDPPFFTKSSFDTQVTVRDEDGRSHKIRHLAYDDIFDRSLESYIANMTARLILIRELLSEDGLLWVHLDWHSSHYLKLVLDEIFGAKNFQNEIIWTYKSGGSGKRHFSRKHDTILLYSKTGRYHLNVPKEKSYNRGLKPYRFKGVKEYRDEYGWYTMVNMKDVWSIDMVGRTSGERTGYATQKPLELMRRILEASTEPGDLAADFFSGSGTFAEAAGRLGRRWIACDSESIANAIARKRLCLREESFETFAPEGTEPMKGKSAVTLIREEALEGGRSLAHFALASFEPEPELGYIALRDRAFTEKLLREQPFSLIDSILIDPDYDGSVFHPEVLLRDGYRDMSFIKRGRAAFLVTDVFGKDYLTYED